MRTKSLVELTPGETGVICDVVTRETDTSNLLEMGLTEGTPIRLVKTAPLGDPLEVQVRGYHLSIRRADARSFVVEQDD